MMYIIVILCISPLLCCDPEEVIGGANTYIVKYSEYSVIFGCEPGYVMYGPSTVYCRGGHWGVKKGPMCASK